MPKVVSAEEKENAILFMTEIKDGVNTWSADMEGLVESSSNFGLFAIGKDGVSGTIAIRSSSAELQDKLVSDDLGLADKCGYKTEETKMAEAWPYNPQNHLMELAKEVYKEQNGEEIQVKAVHGALECGTFHKLDPDMDMISIGPDVTDVHTPRETLYLDSVPKTWKLLEGLLLRVGE
jgi:dipeptidase D